MTSDRLFFLVTAANSRRDLYQANIQNAAYRMPYTVLVGGGYAKLLELGRLTISRFSEASWERECIDMAELASLRFVERLKISEIALRQGISASGVKKALRRLSECDSNV